MSPILEKKEAYKKGTLPLADVVNAARHALKRGQQAEHNVENSLLLPRKVLHTNGFRLSVHFYIILSATLSWLPSMQRISEWFRAAEGVSKLLICYPVWVSERNRTTHVRASN